MDTYCQSSNRGRESSRVELEMPAVHGFYRMYVYRIDQNLIRVLEPFSRRERDEWWKSKFSEGDQREKMF